MSDPNFPPPPPGGAPPPPPGGGAPPPPPPGGGFPPPQDPGGQEPTNQGVPQPGQFQQPGPTGGFVQGQPMPTYQQSQSGGSGVADAFQYGWTKFQQNFGEIIIAIVVWFVAVVVAVGIVIALSTVFMASSVSTYDPQTGTYSAGSSLGFFGFLLTWAVGILLIFAAYFIAGVAFLRVGLLTTKGDQISRSSLFSTENLGPYILTVLLMVLFMAVGYMLCILPGIVVSLFLFFAPFYALDKGVGPMEAFRASITLVNRNLAKVIVLFIGAYIAIAIGNLACGLGIIVAFPVVMIAYAYMYRQLNGEPIAP